MKAIHELYSEIVGGIPIFEKDHKHCSTLFSYCFFDVEFAPDDHKFKVHKLRVKIYNKGTQALECENLFAKMSTGIKKMVHQDDTEQCSRFLETRDAGYVRFEYSFYFKDLKEQNEFFNPKDHAVLV